jgi:hypothetical protein
VLRDRTDIFNPAWQFQWMHWRTRQPDWFRRELERAFSPGMEGLHPDPEPGLICTDPVPRTFEERGAHFHEPVDLWARERETHDLQRALARIGPMQDHLKWIRKQVRYHMLCSPREEELIRDLMDEIDTTERIIETERRRILYGETERPAFEW